MTLIKSFNLVNVKSHPLIKKMAKNNGITNIKTFNNAIGAQKKIEYFSVNEKYSPNFSKDLNGKYQIKVQQDAIDNLVNISNPFGGFSNLSLIAHFKVCNLKLSL